MATWASDALPPADDDATAYDDDAIPADGVLLQRGGTGPAGESIARETGQAPSLYVVIHNIKSSDNVGQLIRTAGAFGAREVLVVSAERTARRMRKNLRTFGAHGSDKRVPMRAFASLAQLIAWVKSQGCRVVGVEIDDSAVSCFSPEAWPVRPTCLLERGRPPQSAQSRLRCSCLRPQTPQLPRRSTSTRRRRAVSCFARRRLCERRGGAKFGVRDHTRAAAGTGGVSPVTGGEEPMAAKMNRVRLEANGKPVFVKCYR